MSAPDPAAVAPDPAAVAPDPAAVAVHEALLARGETVAAAESLTAGLFCATLAEVPGASATLRGGAVVYATDLKAVLVGVPRDLLAEHGAVSTETAASLAEGVRSRCAATWGIGLTGVAGPDPVEGHPPGRVYLGVAGPVRTDVLALDLRGDRHAVRTGAVAAALSALLGRLEDGKRGAGDGVAP